MNNIYFAPLEGLTNHIYRNVFNKHYSGISKFYAPFLDLSRTGDMKKRDRKDILPENNKGIRVVPQVMTKYPEALCNAARELEKFGYDEVNINMGCPYPMEISKGKGAGMLADTENLNKFLNEAFKDCCLDISLKIRIGISDTAEARKIIQVINGYPVKELTVHPRLQKEFYDGEIHEDIFEMIYEESENPVCINPGITTAKNYYYYTEKYKNVSGVMIGRGLLSNPELAEGINAYPDKVSSKPDVKKFLGFHEELLEGYREELSGDVPVLFKMKELWNYWRNSFIIDDKDFKQIKKSNSINEYKERAECSLFERHG